MEPVFWVFSVVIEDTAAARRGNVGSGIGRAPVVVPGSSAPGLGPVWDSPVPIGDWPGGLPGSESGSMPRPPSTRAILGTPSRTVAVTLPALPPAAAWAAWNPFAEPGMNNLSAVRNAPV